MSKTLPVFVVLYYYTKYILTHVWSIVDQNNFFDQMGWTSVHDRMNCSEQCRPCLIMKAYNHTSCGEFWQKTIGGLAPVLKELEFYVKPTVKFFFKKRREIIIVWTFKIYSFKTQISLWILLYITYMQTTYIISKKFKISKWIHLQNISFSCVVL